MANTGALPMHEDFARWYGAVSLGDDHARRESRWEGVSSIVRDANRSTVEGLLRLAHPSRHLPEADVVEAIRGAFRATDSSFEMSGNDRELQILAGVCLAALMDREEDVGAVAALSATTTGFGGARRPDIPMDLGALGETAIVRLGNAKRKRPSLAAYSTAPRRIGLTNVSTEVSAQQTWESVDEAVKIIIAKTRDAMKQIAQTHADAVRAIDCVLRMQDEELQMLWWLTGQRSWDLDCPFDAIAADALPLVLATELADNTEVLPGPPSVKGILSRAGLTDGENVRIAGAVNAADSDWLRTLVTESDPSFVSTPLHAAIKRQQETGPGEEWVAGWAASAGVNANYALSGLALGNLFYRERVLLGSTGS